MPFFVMKSALFVQANVAVNMGVSAGGGGGMGEGHMSPKIFTVGQKKSICHSGKT